MVAPAVFGNVAANAPPAGRAIMAVTTMLRVIFPSLRIVPFRFLPSNFKNQHPPH